MNRAKLFSFFLIAFAALCFPIPGWLSDAGFVWGIPALYFFLFALWCAFIGAMWFFAYRSKSDKA